MQIEDLAPYSPYEAMDILCNAESADLNCMSAQSRGWTLERLSGERGLFWCDRPDEHGRGRCMPRRRWRPTRNVNQAYELWEVVRERMFATMTYSWFSQDLMHMDPITTATIGERKNEEDGFFFQKSISNAKAGSHARAVTMFSIIGLLGVPE